MILSDRDIFNEINEYGSITVAPVPPKEAYQPASLEVHLGDTLLVRDPNAQGIDFSKAEDPNDWYEKKAIGDKLFLGPGEFALAHTVETIKIPVYLAARVEGKSSLGRRGLQIHVSAGFVDPGFSGQITLELVNVSGNNMFLKTGMKIAQIAFFNLSSNPTAAYGDSIYGSHYQNQMGATLSAEVH